VSSGPLLVYFSSTSENTHRFVGKLGFPTARIPLRRTGLAEVGVARGDDAPAQRPIVRVVEEGDDLLGHRPLDGAATVGGHEQGGTLGEDHWSGFRPDKIKTLALAVESVAV